MTLKEYVPYLAGVLCIGFGVVLLWAPPEALRADAGAVGIALSFITGGFAALGVTVAVPAIKKDADREGYKRGVRSAQHHLVAAGPGHPDCGHGHIHLETKNNVNVQDAALAVRAWGNANLQADEEFESVNAMEDPHDTTGGQRPKGSLVIVEVLLRNTGRHSPEAHKRLVDFIALIVEDSACKALLDKSKAKHWCCWSDH